MPKEKTFASIRRKGLERKYDPEPLVERIYELLEEHNESYREASLAAGLDHQAIRRILSGQRPTIVACILLANHWGVHPNEFIQLASWPALDIFNIKTDTADHLPPEAVKVALDIAKIYDPNTRKQVAEAIRTLLTKYFD